MLKIRQNLSSKKRYLSSKAIAKNLDKFVEQYKSLFNKEQYNFALFHATKTEPDTGHFIKKVFKEHDQIYLPQVLEDNSLDFLLLESNSKFITNKFNIIEIEAGAATRKLNLQDFDIIFVPLTAFDSSCHRVGMGKGCYDRTLSQLQKSELPILAGLAFHWQKVGQIPKNTWDIQLDCVINDKEIVHVLI